MCLKKCPLNSDVDECLMEMDLCEQNCTNTPGSYECGCLDGFYESGFNCIGMLMIIYLMLVYVFA